MTGNDKHTSYKNGRLGDGLLLFYPHDYSGSVRQFTNLKYGDLGMIPYTKHHSTEWGRYNLPESTVWQEPVADRWATL